MQGRPEAGEFYRHFKNKLYQIVTVASHSETKEKLVIYQALYGDFGVYARPYDMFISEVDHVKYPDVKQKYRFEKVDLDNNVDNFKKEADTSSTKEEVVKEEAVNKEVVKEEAVNKEVTEDGAISNDFSITSNDSLEEESVNPLLLEFLDTDTYDEKYNLLVSMRDDITDRLIDDIAVVMDLVIPEGDLISRYDNLKQSIRTKQKYEVANRLR